MHHDDDPLTFRSLARDDFAMLAVWLADPVVARWWNHDHGLDAIERDFGPSIDGHDPTEICVAAIAGRPFGLIQRYRVDDNRAYEEELAAVWPVPQRALSIDYFVGEAAFRRRGLGSRMIRTFVAQAWERYPDARDVVVPVAAGNRASRKALMRAGFECVAHGELTPDNPIDSRAHFIYRCRRPAGS